MAGRASRFTQADVVRVLRATDKLGIRDVRIEFEPDGRMIVVIGPAAAVSSRPNSFDALLGP